jgi:hypothetical protein
MLDYQKIGTEYLERLASNPLDAPVLWMLHMKFMSTAIMLDMSDEFGGFLTHYSLNGIRAGNLCKPYSGKKS